MQTDYWKSMETQGTFAMWHAFYEGCLHCACDHGCNQWVKEQGLRSAILFRILSDPKATTKVDKVTRIPLERINKIWFRITGWEAEKFNRELRAQEKAEAILEVERLGKDKIDQAMVDANYDRRKAEEILGIRKYGLSPIFAYVLEDK